MSATGLIRLSRIIIPTWCRTWVQSLPSRLTEYFHACQGGGERSEKPPEQETRAENDLTIKGKAYIAGIYEHPTRHAPDKSTAQLHAECAKGALEDAGLTKADVDGYFCAGDAPGGVMPMAAECARGCVRFSSTRKLKPRFWSKQASSSPTGPPPTMMASRSVFMRARLRMKIGRAHV